MSDRCYAKSQSCQVELGPVRFAREWARDWPQGPLKWYASKALVWRPGRAESQSLQAAEVFRV